MNGSRVSALRFLLAGLFVLALSLSIPAQRAAAAGKTAHDFSFEDLYGEPLPLSDYAGKLILIVNTATECGFRGQLSGLQTLHERYGSKGLVVLGVPSNDFGGQEPRAGEDIAGFCEAQYGAKFPMTAKTHVRGKNAHPFYRWATGTLGPLSRPFWNYHKYLVGPDGELLNSFSTPTRPTARRVVAAIEKHLPESP